MIWGNLPLMTSTAFVLFTNLAQAGKVLNLLLKRDIIQGIISESDEVLRGRSTDGDRKIVKALDMEMKRLHIFYLSITGITTFGWALSAESHQLPLRAWYPYDSCRPPAYELSYFHQVSAIVVAAFLNVSKDTLVAALIAQCRCRLRLLATSLATCCEEQRQVLSPTAVLAAQERLRACAVEHQRVLATVRSLQSSFSVPTFAQFFVSLIIICVSAFQLISQTGNVVRFASMGTYLLNMMFQVFIYCYQGTQLAEESTELANAAYQCPWYKFPVPLRRSLLLIMTRTRSPARLTAGGFTTLSLASFMAIIKASYSLFTLLQQVEEKK